MCFPRAKFSRVNFTRLTVPPCRRIGPDPGAGHVHRVSGAAAGDRHPLRRRDKRSLHPVPRREAEDIRGEAQGNYRRAQNRSPSFARAFLFNSSIFHSAP